MVQTRTSGGDGSSDIRKKNQSNQNISRLSVSSTGGIANGQTSQASQNGFSMESLLPDDGSFSSPYSSGEDDPAITFVGPDPFAESSTSSMDGGQSQFPKNTFEVLRLEKNGRLRQVYARRRDLLREHKLQPRDLRRIDPSVDINKTPPSITVKDNVVVVCLGGIRAIVTGEKALIFEPHAPASVKFVEVVKSHLTTRSVVNGRANTSSPLSGSQDQSLEHREYMSRFYSQKRDDRQDEAASPLPFELEIVESSLMMATGLLDSQMANVSRRVHLLLSKLPQDINPLNLEELRKVKGTLVDLEQRADTLRDMLEELLDDEDELRELNLSSRPRREERQKQREREKLERELERAREIKEEIEERLEDDEVDQRKEKDKDKVSDSELLPDMPLGIKSTYSLPGSDGIRLPPAMGQPNPSSSGAIVGQLAQGRIQELRTKFDRARLSELKNKLNWPQGDISSDSQESSSRPMEDLSKPSGGSSSRDERDGWISRLDDSVEDIQEAQEALEEMVEQEEEEQEVEEVEDLLEYYLQKAAATQDEAEKLLAGARDLEESIGVGLSARRYEVNRLELTLSIGSFAAAVGAMVAGIFGMNMRSSLEHSVHSFWGVGFAIVLGCMGIFAAVLAYTRKRRIL